MHKDSALIYEVVNSSLLQLTFGCHNKISLKDMYCMPQLTTWHTKVNYNFIPSCPPSVK